MGQGKGWRRHPTNQSPEDKHIPLPCHIIVFTQFRDLISRGRKLFLYIRKKGSKSVHCRGGNDRGVNDRRVNSDRGVNNRGVSDRRVNGRGVVSTRPTRATRATRGRWRRGGSKTGR